MTRIAAVIVDTYSENRLARLAIERTLQTGLVDQVHTFSIAPIYPGEVFHPINPIRSVLDYSHFMLNIVPHCVDADAVLVIQWDGMPCDRTAWRDEFLGYDYIGAPWGHCDPSVAVGNGGFSLRSRKLMQTLAMLKIRPDPSLPESDAEDVVICRHYRADILRAGCSFAPLEVAHQFAFENERHGSTFGFHGVFNMPGLLPEAELLGTCDELVIRTARDFFLANFLLACLRHQHMDLYQQLVASLDRAGRRAAISQLLQSGARRLPLL
jgi:hypothetical protein